MTAPVTNWSMTRDEARALTDEVKTEAHALWGKLLRLYEGRAWEALDYKSWGSYYEAEFGGSSRHGYRLLDAGRVLEELEPTGFRGERAPGSPALNEAAARELAPVLRNGGDAVREAYEKTVDRHGPEPTAKQVREVVQQRRNGAPPPVDTEPTWAVRMGLLAGELRYIASVATAEERAEHARAALGVIADVMDDLEQLAGEDDGSF